MKKSFILGGVLLAFSTIGSNAQYWSQAEDAPVSQTPTGPEFVWKSKSVYPGSSQYPVNKFTPGIKESGSTTYFSYEAGLEPHSSSRDYGFTSMDDGLLFNNMYYFSLSNIKDNGNGCTGFASTKGGRIGIMEGSSSLAHYISTGKLTKFKNLLLTSTSVQSGTFDNPATIDVLRYYEGDADEGIKSLDLNYLLPRKFDFWDKVNFVDFVTVGTNKLTLLYYNDSLLQYELYEFDNTLDTATTIPGFENSKLMEKVATPGVQSEEGSGYYISNNKVYIAGKDSSIVSFGAGIAPETVFQSTDYNGKRIGAKHVYGAQGNKLLFNYYDDSAEKFRIFYYNDGLLKEFSALSRNKYSFGTVTAMYNNQSNYYNVVANDEFMFITHYPNYNGSFRKTWKVLYDSIMTEPVFDYEFNDDAYFADKDGTTYFFDGIANWYVNSFLGKVKSGLSKGNCPGDTVEIILEVRDGAEIKWYTYSGNVFSGSVSDTVMLEGQTNDTLIVSRGTEDTHFYAEATLNGKTFSTKPYTMEIPDGAIPDFRKQITADNGCPGEKSMLEFTLADFNYDSAKWYMDGQLVNHLDKTANGKFELNLTDTTVGMYNVVIYGGSCSYAISSDTVKADTLGLPVIASDLADIVGCEGSVLGQTIIATETDGSEPEGGLVVKKAREKNHRWNLWYYNYYGSTVVMDDEFMSSDTGYYFVQVHGKCGNINSDTFAINLGHPYTIEKALNSGFSRVCPGEELKLEVNAVSESPLYYQWYLDSVALEEETGKTLELPDLDSTDAGAYSVEIKGYCKNDTAFGPFEIAINEETRIIKQPQDTAISERISLVVDAESALSFTWYKDDAEIRSSPSNSLLINAEQENAGEYKVKVTGMCGEVESDPFQLSIKAVSISEQLTADVKLYPNPASRFVHVEMAEPGFLVKVHDITGKTLLSQVSGDNNLRLDISALQHGIYFITVEHAGTESIYKLIKQ